MSRFLRSLLQAPLVAGALLAALGAVTGAATAQEIGLADQWHAPTTEPPDLRRILVIGVSHDAALRRHFEDRFVSLLRGRVSDGIPSYTIVPDLAAAPDPQTVVDALFAKQVDGVITVFLEPLAERAPKGWAAGWRERVVQETTVRAYVGEALKASTKGVKWFGVDFALWSVKTGQRLWAGRTDGQRLGPLRDQASDLVQAIINDLTYDKLLR
jgi:hypothetical protein